MEAKGIKVDSGGRGEASFLKARLYPSSCCQRCSVLVPSTTPCLALLSPGSSPLPFQPLGELAPISSIPIRLPHPISSFPPFGLPRACILCQQRPSPSVRQCSYRFSHGNTFFLDTSVLPEKFEYHVIPIRILAFNFLGNSFPFY